MFYYNSEQTVQELIKTTLGDIQNIKRIQGDIDAGWGKNEDEKEDWMNDPRFPEVKEAILNENKKKLQQLKTRGSDPDGLHPIVVLLGDASIIQQDVIAPFKSEVQNDSHYGWDIELREVESSLLTKEYVRSLSAPSGKDGGVLFVRNLSLFSEMYANVNDQNQIVRDIMVNPFGGVSTGWRIIFIENTLDKDYSFSNSFVNSWTKGSAPMVFFVEDN